MSGNAISMVLHRTVDRTPTEFEDVCTTTLEALLNRASGRCITLDELYTHTPAAELPLCLTFDDGYSSDCDLTLPLLTKFNARATFFVITGSLGKSGYLDAHQIRDLFQAGMQIGSHSVSHVDMTSLSKERILLELLDSKSAIEDILGCEISTFSFPFGEYNRELIDLVLSLGFKRCCISDRGITQSHNPVTPRISVNKLTKIKDFDRYLKPSTLQVRRWAWGDSAKRQAKRRAPRLYRSLKRMIS